MCGLFLPNIGFEPQGTRLIAKLGVHYGSSLLAAATLDRYLHMAYESTPFKS